MIKLKNLSIMITFLCLAYYVKAQEKSIHDEINTDIYRNFSKAYQALDFNLFASIHSKEMIRASGDGGIIKTVTEYLNGYQKRWSDPKRKPAFIDFRLFERVNSDSLVSDRGIYKVTYKNDKDQIKHSYGQFHLVLKLEGKNWKIIFDYDSNENKSIDINSFDNAFSLSDYKKYSKH